MRLRLSGGRLLVVLTLLAAIAAFVFLTPREDPRSLVRDERVPVEDLTAGAPVSAENAIPTVELVMEEDTLQELESAFVHGDPSLLHEPGGDRPFFDALVLAGSTPTRCKVALIAPAGHHDPAKPSFRIKVRKALASGGKRRTDLYRPEDPLALEALLYSDLAGRLDLIGDRSTPVRLFLNKRSFGVYLRALPPGPSMSHAARRLPGTFVFNEAGPEGWTDVSSWHRFGTDEVSSVPLVALLAVVAAPPTPESSAELRRMIDFESLARWSAARIVLGRVAYPGAQRCLFFGEHHGRIEAVAWPFDGMSGAADTPFVEPGDPLLARLEQEADWRRRRDEWVGLLLAEMEAEIPERVVSHHAELAPELAADLNLVVRDPRAGLLRRVAATELDHRRAEWTEWFERRIAFVRGTLTVPAEASPQLAPVVLGPGTVELKEDVVTAPGQRLVLRAGTRLELARDVGIYARGPTLVEGTEAAPVVLRGATWEPWATFALTGPGTAGSRISHLDTEDGSTGKLFHQSFDAAFSLYECPDVQIAYTRFGPSSGGGDSVHAARSELVFEHCLFDDARRDALDLTFSAGRLSDCRFIGADRNGIDFFASRFLVERCHVDGASRSAISVGEGSLVSLVDCVLERNDLGLDCHDDGRTLVRGGAFQANRVAVFCEVRDWRHDRAGAVALAGVRFDESLEHDILARQKSEVLIHGSVPGLTTKGRSRIEHVEAIPAGWLEQAARGPSISR